MNFSLFFPFLFKLIKPKDAGLAGRTQGHSSYHALLYVILPTSWTCCGLELVPSRMIRLRLARDDSVLQGDKLDVLKYCQQRKLVTDVTLIIDNHVYYAHKLVLASISRTAREDFLAGGCGQSTLILTGIKPLDLENTMRLIYDAEILLPYGELPGLFKVARALGIDQFEPNEFIDIPDDLIRSLPKKSQLRSKATKSCTTVVDTGPSCPTNTPTGLIRCDLGRSGKFQDSNNSQCAPDSLFEPLSPIITTTLPSTMQCSFTVESSSDSIGSPEHLRNVQDLQVNGSIPGDYGHKIQQEESVRREDEFIMDTASANISFAHEFIKNSTSVWDEEAPEDTSLGLLDVAMFGSSLPTDSSCFQTTDDIVQHVENLPTDIDTPSPWRGSPAGDVKGVKSSPTDQMNEESRPPTPVLKRRLRKEIMNVFPTDGRVSADKVSEARPDAVVDKKKGVCRRLRNKRKL